MHTQGLFKAFTARCTPTHRCWDKSIPGWHINCNLHKWGHIDRVSSSESPNVAKSKRKQRPLFMKLWYFKIRISPLFPSNRKQSAVENHQLHQAVATSALNTEIYILWIWAEFKKNLLTGESRHRHYKSEMRNYIIHASINDHEHPYALIYKENWSLANHNQKSQCSEGITSKWHGEMRRAGYPRIHERWP